VRTQSVRWLPWLLLLLSFLPFLRPHPHTTSTLSYSRHDSAAHHISELYTAAVDDPRKQLALDVVEASLDSLFPSQVRCSHHIGRALWCMVGIPGRRSTPSVSVPSPWLCTSLSSALPCAVHMHVRACVLPQG
jgi:hypothetical protein